MKILRPLFFAIGFLLVFATPRAKAQDHIGIGAQIAANTLPEFGETALGYGFRFTYGGFLPFIAVDTEYDTFPTSSSGNIGETQVFLGLKGGFRVRKWGIFGKLRSGVAVFGGGSAGRLRARTDFDLDIGGGIEYYFVPHVALRWDLSDVATFFGDGVLTSGPGRVGVPLGTQHNFETTAGIVVGF